MRGNASIASVERTLSGENRDRDPESVQTLFERRNLHVYFEEEADLVVQGECAAQRRLFEAEADMNMRNWEQRNADVALHETNRELDLTDWSCIRRTNGQMKLEEKRFIYAENWK